METQEAQRLAQAETPTAQSARWPDIAVVDNFLNPELQAHVFRQLNGPGWQFGWKSKAERDIFSFWHKHYAGARHSDHKEHAIRDVPYDCLGELTDKHPLLCELWHHLEATQLPGHKLVRCYANAAPFGSEGTLHTDSAAENSFTSIYYPHPAWFPDWAGETVFFNDGRTDILQSVYPRPNRLLMFRGKLPHVARAVSRTCPVSRITLMFKSEFPDA